MERTKQEIEKIINKYCKEIFVILKDKNYKIGVTQHFKSKDKMSIIYFEPRIDTPFVLSDECKEVRIDKLNADGTTRCTEFYKIIK